MPDEAISLPMRGLLRRQKAASRNDMKWKMPMAGKEYTIYIMTNAHNRVLYTGVTNNLKRRVYEHKSEIGGIFTRKYNVVKLIYYETGDNIREAIAREK